MTREQVLTDIETNVTDQTAEGSITPVSMGSVLTNIAESASFPEYLVYTALLSQSGENAPVATVLKNTLGGTPDWSYEGLGNYRLSLMNAFPSAKTFILNQTGYDPAEDRSFSLVHPTNGEDENSLLFQCIMSHGITQDDLLVRYAIEIRVYP